MSLICPLRPRSAVSAVVLLAVLLFSAQGRAELRVGRAKVDLTPPLGSVMGNSYGISVVAGVTSPVHAKAVVFATAEGKAALVACDLISLHPPIVARARALIAERTGVAPDRVILAATHCHAGPQTHPLLYGLVGEEPRRLSEAYVARLPGLIAESVRLAEADLQPARLKAGSGAESGISFNRRILLRDGSVKMNPGAAADKVRPMGPIDPQVGVVVAESLAGEPLVTIVNFALHVAVVGGDRISADYPHTLARELAQAKGAGMLTVFINGMSGNINHVNVFAPGGLRGEPEAERIGRALAAAVLRTWPTLRPVDAERLRAVSRPVRVPVLAAPNPGRLAEAQATLARHGKGASFADVIRAWRDIDLATYGPEGTWASEVQAIAFGRDLALVGYPGDSFVEMGLFIKQNSPFAFTFVSEQSGNGSISYVPNEKAFPEGSYEVESARVAPGGGEVLATAASRLLTELFPRP
jgi:neutral ceramidase